MHLVEIVRDHQAGAAGEGVFEGLGIDERIAVAVAADPAADTKNGFHFRPLRRWQQPRQRLFHVFIEAGQFAQEGVAEKRLAVLDFVDDAQAGQTQHAGLPQGEDPGAQRFEIGVGFAGREGRARLHGDQACDIKFSIENALALDFCGMRGQDRGQVRLLEKVAHPLGRDLRGGDTLEGEFDRPFAGGLAGQRVGALAAIGMDILGDVRQMREIGKRAHHRDSAIARQGVEAFDELVARLRVAVAAKPHRELTHGFNGFKGIAAFLLPDGFAEQAAEQANVFTQRAVVICKLASTHRRSSFPVAVATRASRYAP